MPYIRVYAGDPVFGPTLAILSLEQFWSLQLAGVRFKPCPIQSAIRKVAQRQYDERAKIAEQTESFANHMDKSTVSFDQE